MKTDIVKGLDKHRQKRARFLLIFVLTAALMFGTEYALYCHIYGRPHADVDEGFAMDNASVELDAASLDVTSGAAETAPDGHSAVSENIEGEGDDAGPAINTELTDEEKIAYIQGNPELYTENLMEFAQEYSEAVDFVYQYPDMYGKEEVIDLSAEAASGSVPLLIQWDARWGYHDYGGGLLGYTGCGPTCLSMAALYLTGNAAYTPVYIADYAQANGYYVEGDGTAWSLMDTGCSAFGLSSSKLSIDEGTLAQALDEGRVVICSMSEGDFTTGGHFIVLASYADGAFTVNDPNSPANSSRTWTFDELSWQIRCAWAFSAA